MFPILQFSSHVSISAVSNVHDFVPHLVSVTSEDRDIALERLQVRVAYLEAELSRLSLAHHQPGPNIGLSHDELTLITTLFNDN